MAPLMAYAFGPFVLDVANRKLLNGSEPVAITARVFDLLTVLVERAGQPVTKETLMEQVWGDVAVEEGNVARHVSTLRKVLGDSGDAERFIATLAGRGYQFVGPVRVVDEAASATELSAPVPAPVRSRGIGVRVAIAVGVLATIAWLTTLALRRDSGEPQVRIVVLPFENLTGDSGQDFFTDGLTEEMIAELSRVNPARLAVIARTSAMSFKGMKKSIDDIRRELNVDYVLEGSARREGDRVRITAQLIETTRQTHLLAQSYDRDRIDPVAVQQDVARAIAREIRIELTPQEAARLANVRAIDLAAHEQYLQGRHALSRGSEADIRSAIEWFERSITKDPGYALPYAGIADAVVALTDFYVSPEETHGRGRRSAQRAIELDDSLAEAHTSLATIHMMFDWDWAAAEREYRRAIELRPSYADAHSWYGYYLAAMARFEEAIDEVTAAERLDPLSVATHLNASWVFYLARRPADSMAHVKRALALDPHLSITHGSIWAAYAPIQDLVRTADIDRETAAPIALASLAGAAAVAGRRGEAEELLGRLKAIGEHQHVCPYEMASAYAALHDAEQAFKYLERSYEERSPCLPDLKTDPRFDNVRNDARYTTMLQRLNLAPGNKPIAR